MGVGIFLMASFHIVQDRLGKRGTTHSLSYQLTLSKCIRSISLHMYLVRQIPEIIAVLAIWNCRTVASFVALPTPNNSKVVIKCLLLLAPKIYSKMKNTILGTLLQMSLFYFTKQASRVSRFRFLGNALWDRCSRKVSTNSRISAITAWIFVSASRLFASNLCCVFPLEYFLYVFYTGQQVYKLASQSIFWLLMSFVLTLLHEIFATH